jgi:hypothetical protein
MTLPSDKGSPELTIFCSLPLGKLAHLIYVINTLPICALRVRVPILSIQAAHVVTPPTRETSERSQ